MQNILNNCQSSRLCWRNVRDQKSVACMLQGYPAPRRSKVDVQRPRGWTMSGIKMLSSKYNCEIEFTHIGTLNKTWAMLALSFIKQLHKLPMSHGLSDVWGYCHLLLSAGKHGHEPQLPPTICTMLIWVWATAELSYRLSLPVSSIVSFM